MRLALFLSLWFSGIANASLIDLVDQVGLMDLSKEYRSFLINDYVQSDYCQEGWGDGKRPGIIMREACAKSQKELLIELDKSETIWTEQFSLEEENSNAESVTYLFQSFPKLSKKAPLSCIFTLEFTLDQQKKIIEKSLDLYCDH